MYFLVQCITCTTLAFVVHNKLLGPLSRKVQFGVWIDILVKDKFTNLRKKIYFLIFICFLFVASLLLVFSFFFFVFL